MSRARARRLGAILGAILAASAGVAACRGPRVAAARPSPPVFRATSHATSRAADAASSLPPIDPSPPPLSALLARADPAAELLVREAGRDIDKSLVFDRWAELDPGGAARVVELCRVDARVLALAKRYEVQVPAAELRLAMRRERARLERARARQAPGSTLADFVETRYGLGLAAYLERARRVAWRRLLRAYTLRHVLARRGGVRLRWFFALDRSTAEACHEQTAAGAELAALCRRYSADASASQGGELPELPLDHAHPAVALAEGQAVGELSPVVATRGPKRREGFAFCRVLARRAPDPRRFAETWRELRAELERRPVGSAELALLLSGS